MASKIVVNFRHENKEYTANTIGGRVSVSPIVDDVHGYMLEADLKLQSWPSFTLSGIIHVEVLVKIGAKPVSRFRFVTNSVRVTRSEKGHSFTCLIKELDLREYFGRFYEHSA